jgi:hypothetical protein
MIGKIKLREGETRVIPVTLYALAKFSRAELRGYAKSIGVPVGRGKMETVANLLHSGKATMLAQLGD